MDIEFRKADISELNEVLELYSLAIESMKEAGIDQWDEEYPSVAHTTRDVESGELVVGVYDGNIVCAYVVNEEEEPEYKTAPWEYPELRSCAMHRLCVSPLYHRRGFAQSAMKNIEINAKKEGYEVVHLDTFCENYKALSMYKKIGYKPVLEVEWRKGRFVIMEKKL